MTAARERTGAVVLAGGAARRFGRDKLAESLDGIPLLERAIAAVRPLAATVVVVLAPDDDRRLAADVRVVHDAVAHEGPLVGLGTGLASMPPDISRVVVVGGDMPTLAGSVLARLLDTLDGPALACLADDAAHARPLPMAVRLEEASTAVDDLTLAGERRLRALIGRLGGAVLAVDAWRDLDPEAATLRDVDVPDDLAGRPSRTGSP